MEEDATITIRECLACGAQSVPFFGLAFGCRENGGSHRETCAVEVPLASVRRTLRAMYQACPSFDRARFHTSATADLQALVR